MNTVIVLDNIRSAHNVGSILRTADFFGFKEIVLCGVTPGIIDRFGRNNTKVTKVSLGAENTLSISHDISIYSVLRRFKAMDYVIIGIEQDIDSVFYCDYNYNSVSQPKVIVFGEETQGLTKDVRKICDFLIEIPKNASNSKESLNVSVTAGIILSKFSETQALHEQR